LLALVGAAPWTLARADERSDEKQACASAAEDAEQLRIDARLLAARERLLRCARAECPAAVRSDCVQWMTEVAAAMPTVVLGARDAGGRDVLSARVSVDGVVVAHGLDGKAVEVDPGVHKFRFESDGAAVEQTVIIREGEKNRAVTTTLDPGRVASTGPAAASASSPRRTAPLQASVWTWALGGVDADAKQLQRSCGHSCSHAQVVPLVLKQQVLAPVAFGVGALSLGLATYTLFAGSEKGGAMAGVRGRF
jgi:hypothetical protein